jgi:hypothetical protein
MDKLLRALDKPSHRELIWSDADDQAARTFGWELSEDIHLDAAGVYFGAHHDHNDVVLKREQEFARQLRAGNPLHIKAALAVIFGGFEP